MDKQTKEIKFSDFDALKIGLASPEEILSWSHGEVTRAETINYRTQRPEREGLFSEQIFGPVKDYECACGKYKGARYKGVVCDRCGVEVTHSFVRRERMGHIKLVTPVAHIWFLRSIPSRIGLLLDIPQQDLEQVVYYNSYVITKVDEAMKKKALAELESEYKSKLHSWPSEQKKKLLENYESVKKELNNIKERVVLSEVDYLRLARKYGQVFTAETGALPIRRFLESLDLKELEKQLVQQIEKHKSKKQINRKLLRRLRLVRDFLQSGNRPEWMILTVLPVLPPDLRPMVQLDGGKFASYDLNDLYRRVINRNNRLKKLLELKAPEVIIKNEKRMLQEAVDALLDNSIRRTTRRRPMRASQHRPLRSLADILQGKEGRFRQNLLGKRVDYSGRSVIVINPDLKIHECGMPKKMALEIFKPFVISELIKRGEVHSPKMANRLIEEERDVVWEVLEKVVQGKFVLLNRAPTLHRLSIEAFQPKLIEGLAIQIPALVCQPFNADFDGDQMALHLPLTEEAQRESEQRMLATLGLLKPANGEPVMLPRLDMVLGIYWLTMEVPSENSVDSHYIFSSPREALIALDNKLIEIHQKIKVRIPKLKNQLIETTAGRLMFNEILPEHIPFLNQTLGKKELKKLARDIIYSYTDFRKAAEVLDKIKELGFRFATLSGISWSFTDLKVPPEKKKILEETEKKVEEIYEQYEQGLLTDEERSSLVEAQWREATDKVSDLVKKVLQPTDSVFVIFNSGARGNWTIASQIMGMKGQVVNPAGKLIEMPILSSHQEGFNVLEYFAASHAGRKGLADTALKTSFAGYLTRRLIDVSHDVIIREKDCGTKKYLLIKKEDVEERGGDFYESIWGRYLADKVVDKSGKIIAQRNDLIDDELAHKIVSSGISEVKVRSPLKCESDKGICQRCYGLDLGWKKPIELGEAVGIVAAQAIGEPGTQLTLRTFHTGGVARAVDITQGLPRVEELLEARTPKGEAPLSEVDGEVEEIVTINHQKYIRIKVRSSSGTTKAKKKEKIVEYVAPEGVTVWVKKGEKVKRGQQLTEGSLDLRKLLEYRGEEACQNYILQEVKKVYQIAGEKINDKHFEIIIRQMFSRVRITDPGDSKFVIGEIVPKNLWKKVVSYMKKKNKKPPKAKQIVLGIKRVALTSPSFLSAASFQETSRILISAAIKGQIDYLEGLKENVILGRLIPAGTGWRR